MERKCNECIHKKENGCEKWNCEFHSEFEPKYADPTEDAGTLAEQENIHLNCGFTAEEISKGFIKDVKAVEGLLPDAEMEKFVSLTYANGVRTYVKADTIVQLADGGDETLVYTINDSSPMFVKESMDEIVVRIGGIVC